MNKKGEAYFILNRYDNIDYKPSISRGIIIKQILDGQSINDIKLEKIAPFILISLSENYLTEHNWNGKVLTKQQHEVTNFFITSSSEDEENVRQWRKEKYLEWLNNKKPYKNELPEYNLLCKKGYENYSPLVLRDKTKTKSICQIILAEKITFKYFPNPFDNKQASSIKIS